MTDVVVFWAGLRPDWGALTNLGWRRELDRPAFTGTPAPPPVPLTSIPSQPMTSRWVEPPRPEKQQRRGLTPAEDAALRLTADLWNQLLALPELHPDDIAEHRRDIHDIQNRVMARACLGRTGRE